MDERAIKGKTGDEDWVHCESGREDQAAEGEASEESIIIRGDSMIFC